MCELRQKLQNHFCHYRHDYLNQRSPLQGSGFEDQLNQYGSNISHGEGGSPSSDQHRCTPRRECSSPPQVSQQPTPSQPLVGAGEVHSLSEGASLESQPVVASSTVQDMDVDTVLTSLNPHIHAAAGDPNRPPLDEIALVEQTFTERVLINCSDISSCGSPRPLLGESTDGDSDQDERGVDQGVTLPAAEDLQRPESVLVARPPADDHSRPIAANAGADVRALVEDKFYNATGKAPHPDSVIPKVESGWWKNREMRKKRKAEERAKAELELQKMREDATCLAEQNANLQRELNLARLSLSGASDPPIPTTSAAFVRGPHGQDVSTTGRGISPSTGGVVDSALHVVVESVLSLRSCGTHSTAVGSGDYLRPEDNSLPSEIEGAEDSLQFQTETDLGSEILPLDILLPSPDVAAASVVEEGGIARRSGEADIEKSSDEKGSDEEEESEEVEGDDEEVEGDEEEEEDDDEGGDDEEEGQMKAVDGGEVKGKEIEDQGRDTERLDYGSGPGEGSPSTLHMRSHSQMRSQVQIVDYADSGSDKVLFSLTPILSILCFLMELLGVIPVVSSFVASYTNDVD